MNIKTFTAKLGSMRKADEYVVYPMKKDDKVITIQGDRSCAFIDVATGRAILNTKNNYIFMIRVCGKATQVPQEVIDKALAAAEIDNGNGIALFS